MAISAVSFSAVCQLFCWALYLQLLIKPLTHTLPQDRMTMGRRDEGEDEREGEEEDESHI